MNNLFRKQVIEKQAQRHLGDVFLSSPLSFWVITCLIALIIAGLVLIAVFGEYSRKERVAGFLIPSHGLLRIIPQQNGTIEAIHVKSGEIVEAGTPLLKITDNTALADGNSVSSSLLENMKLEKQNLQDQLKTIPRQYALTRERLETRKTEFLAEAGRYLSQINIQNRTIELEKDVLTRLQDLFEDEAASGLEVSSQENRYLGATQVLNDLKNNREKLLAEVKDIDAQISLLPIEQTKEISDFKNRISTIGQTIIRTDAERTSIIHSPIEGKIATVTARRGQMASPQKAAMTILPTGGELQAELFVPTRAAGFIKPGQSVRLLYDAFPYQKFGFYDGTVKEVSKTVITTTDLSIAPQFPEPVFLVTVSLNDQSILSQGENFPLQSGMSLSADLILEDRKIWEWVFEPLLGAMR